MDWKDTCGRNVKLCTENVTQHVTSCYRILKNVVVSGEKFAFELNSDHAFYVNLTAIAALLSPHYHILPIETYIPK